MTITRLFPVTAAALAALMLCNAAQAQKRPAGVGRQLTDICQKSGFGRSDLKRCAAAFEQHCRTANLDPKSQRCWQHLLQQDDRRSLDYKALRQSR